MKKSEMGEGNYKASETFQTDQHAFAKTDKAKVKAREAADALDSPEGAELEKARKAAAKGSPD